jgi:hypothetical protein
MGVRSLTSILDSEAVVAKEIERPLALSTMATMRALSRTRVLLAPAEKHPLAMTKWWKKVRPAEGEVRGFAEVPDICG